MVHRDLKPANVYLVPQETRRARAAPGSGPTARSERPRRTRVIGEAARLRPGPPGVRGIRRPRPGSRCPARRSAQSPTCRPSRRAARTSTERRPLGHGHDRVRTAVSAAGRSRAAHPALGPARDSVRARPREPLVASRSVPERLPDARRASALAKDKAARPPPAEELRRRAGGRHSRAARPPGSQVGSRLCAAPGGAADPLAAVLVLATGWRRPPRVQLPRSAWARARHCPRSRSSPRPRDSPKPSRSRNGREKVIPGDPMLARLWPTISRTPSSVERAGRQRQSSYKDYDNAAGRHGSRAGMTPLKDVPGPGRLFPVAVRENGFETLEAAGGSGALPVTRGES